MVDIMPEINITVVQLRTEAFKKGNSYAVTKLLSPLKRKSNGFNILDDQIQHELPDLLLIENLNDVDDGTYEIQYSGLTTDPLSGETEYDGFILIPFCCKCDNDRFILEGCCGGGQCGCMGMPTSCTNCTYCNPKALLHPSKRMMADEYFQHAEYIGVEIPKLELLTKDIPEKFVDLKALTASIKKARIDLENT
ncbi:hypothetical protein COPG_00118 [Colwellia phage 9A]|uniref:Uncharacterized protein n=1 Tax=Colwellia phage 9A TaxID=765765 RepID=I3UMJ9_9CAUD|nr:hypothetical protein COPG_00118 [Colwellia phage 9A]AFK66714.1 hypothetical protein COPG_00118 [Colwellia phage 9A]